MNQPGTGLQARFCASPARCTQLPGRRTWLPVR